MPSWREDVRKVNIIVCVKRVPDTGTRIRIARGGSAIDPEGLRHVMNPYDEFALEAGLRTREAVGEGEVTAVSLGDAQSEETLRAALALGADRAILIEGTVTHDGLATAKVLASVIEEDRAELILLGKKAVDDDQEQVGPMLATLLGWSCASAVSQFELEGGHGSVRCARAVEGGTQYVRLPLPSVLTITKGAFEPRFASMKGIMAAKRKPLERRPAKAVASRLRLRSLELPPERSGGEFIGEGAGAVPELVRILRDEEGLI